MITHPTTAFQPTLTGNSPARKSGVGSVAGCVSTVQPPDWATAPKPILPADAPTVGYLCGGAGIMSGGFKAAGIKSLWNIDRGAVRLLSDAIAQIYGHMGKNPNTRLTKIQWTVSNALYYTHQRINDETTYQNLADAMEPWDYCEIWVKDIEYGSHGYRAECVRELVRALGGKYKFETINRTWGAKFEKRPDSVTQVLQNQHVFKTLHLKLSEIGSSIKHIDKDIGEIMTLLNKSIH